MAIIGTSLGNVEVSIASPLRYASGTLIIKDVRKYRGSSYLIDGMWKSMVARDAQVILINKKPVQFEAIVSKEGNILSLHANFNSYISREVVQNLVLEAANAARNNDVFIKESVLAEHSAVYKDMVRIYREYQRINERLTGIRMQAVSLGLETQVISEESKISEESTSSQ